MHKRLVNHCTIDCSIIADGPILVKSGQEGIDPTKPQMEFVETFHQGGKTIYLPGSGLKGAIRAHAERIVRTVGKSKRDPKNLKLLWAGNPLDLDSYKYLDNEHLDPHVKELLKSEQVESDSDEYQYLFTTRKTATIHQLSSFTDRMFGSTAIASRIRIEDAHPDPEKPLKLEERNGVAIDRVFGSVAVGPFDYQVCTMGEFRTKIHLKNFSLAQLGLIGLVLRDLNEGWFGLGFAKSRGLGTVKVKYNSASVKYPGCQLLKESKEFNLIGQDRQFPHNHLLGAGEFLDNEEAKNYGFPKPDYQVTPIAAQSMMYGFGVQQNWIGNDETGVPNLFLIAVKAWSQMLTGGVAA